MGVVCCARGVITLKHPVVQTSYKQRKVRYIALLLGLFAITLLASCNQAKPTTAKPKSDRVSFDLSIKDPNSFETLGVSEGNGITVTFEKTAEWDTGNGDPGFTGYITLLNQTGEALDDWDLKLSFPHKINQAWGAKLSTASAAANLINPEEDATYTFIPESWNAKLAHSQSRSFGFNGTFNEVFVEPSAYVLSGIPVSEQAPPLPPVGECKLETRFQVNSSWENGDGTQGFVAELYVTSVASQPVNWTLDFDFDVLSIQNMWNAEFIRDESSFSVTPNAWNTRLEPGETTHFGFQGINRGELGEPQNISCGGPVEPENNPPTVDITAPADQKNYSPSQEITFTATASDIEDGDLSDAITWSSDLAGDLGTGASITTLLPLGTNIITVSATDQAGSTASSTLTINVVKPPPTEPEVVGSSPDEFGGLGGTFSVVTVIEDVEGNPITDELELDNFSFTDISLAPVRTPRHYVDGWRSRSY